jgi:hypothetical protein
MPVRKDSNRVHADKGAGGVRKDQEKERVMKASSSEAI